MHKMCLVLVSTLNFLLSSLVPKMVISLLHNDLWCSKFIWAIMCSLSFQELFNNRYPVNKSEKCIGGRECEGCRPTFSHSWPSLGEQQIWGGHGPLCSASHLLTVSENRSTTSLPCIIMLFSQNWKRKISVFIYRDSIDKGVPSFA